MKKLFIVSAIAMSGLIYNTANAQIGIRIGLHLSPRRVYTAPVVVEQPPVYNDGDDYYYLPDVDAYYSVDEQCYYYFDGDNWIAADYLPGVYHDYDWRSARRYEIRESRPYLHNSVYRSRYNGYTENGRWERHGDYQGYASAHYGNSGYGHNDHFDNHRDGGYSQQPQAYRRNDRNDNHFGTRKQGDYNQPRPYRSEGDNSRHFDNRGGGNYSQPSQPNNEHGNYGQPAQGGHDQHFDNRGQGSYTQPSPQNSGHGSYGQPAQGGRDQHFDNGTHGTSAQPSQPDRGQDHGNRGGNGQGNQGSPRGGFANRSMARF